MVFISNTDEHQIKGEVIVVLTDTVFESIGTDMKRYVGSGGDLFGTDAITVPAKTVLTIKFSSIKLKSGAVLVR